MDHSTINSYKDGNAFDQYVFRKIIDLGFRVYGGAVRNRLWRSVYEKQRKSQYDSRYFDLIWDYSFSPETEYNRKGTFVDIDCIGTYEQFQLLSSPEMDKFGDLRYKISEKTIRYPIPELEIVKGELETFTVKVTSKIRSHHNRSVEIDMFVCKSDKLDQLYQLLGRNLDFACNGLCMQKINGVIMTSLLHCSSFERQLAVIEEMKRDEASLMRHCVDKTMFHRVAKMIAYGWYAEFASLEFYNYDGNGYPTSNKLEVFARASDSVRCAICGERQESYRACIYARIGHKTMHLSCYIARSIRCYESNMGVRFGVSDTTEPDIVDTDSVHEEVLTVSEVLEPTPSPVVIESEFEPIPDQFSEGTHAPSVASEENQDDSDIEELERFTQFARRQEQTLDDVVPERNEHVQIVGNVAFFNGIAQELDEYELFNLRQQLGIAENDDDDDDSDFDANEEIERYSLCSLSSQKELLTVLKEFSEYMSRRYITARRP